MEAHNGLSAKIVEETGFKGVWASGLSISASLGVRDNNEASWTQVLEVVEFMADATSIPILLDGDTGYGNFNNMRRAVRKLEQRGAAAICIEDKIFPKTNSFIHGDRQPLADIDEFAGKIKAVKDAQQDPDFCLVARIEAFIAGWGLDEALRRAEAYHEAGADALLIHSSKRVPDQILDFARAWDRPCPIVIVPTKYYSTPTERFEQAGIRLVIWANHNLRSAISAMQHTSRQIFNERTLLNVEDTVAPLPEVFRLQNAEELIAAEERYLPQRPDALRAIILAASQGGELGALTADKPKAMLPVGGTPLLHTLVRQLRAARIRDITVVRGFAKASVHAPEVTFVDNDEHASTGELYSLAKAQDRIQGDVIISFGDILFRKYILNNLLDEPHDLVLAVDAAWKERPGASGHLDYVSTTQPHSLKYEECEACLTDIGPNLPPDRIHGEWIGLLKCSRAGSELLRAALKALQSEPNFRALRFDDLFRYLLAKGARLHVHYITGHWLDIDSLDDLTRAQAFA